MASSHRLSVIGSAAIAFSTLQLFLPAATAQSAAPSNGFFDKTAADITPPAPKRPELTPEMRGDIFMAEKRYTEAAEMYREHSKGSAVLLNKTGIAYHQMLQLDLAEKYYRESLRIDPKYPEAINNLGTVYYAKKSYRRSVNQYKKALRLNPNSASVWSNLGTGYFARKDYAQAADCWRRALMLDPDVFEKRSNQGVLLQERSMSDPAKYHYFMAQTYAKAGMNDRALQNLRKALEEGYKEKKKLLEDPAFASMRELPEFKELMALEPRVL